MSEIYIDLPEEEWNKINSSRHVDFGPDKPYEIIKKKFSFPLEFKEAFTSNPNFRIGNLQFVECVFASTVVTRGYLYSGKLLFKKCTFEYDVAVESMENVTFEDGCIFFSDLSIHMRDNNMELRNIKVNGTTRVVGNNGGKLTLNNINKHSAITKQKLSLLVRCQSIEIKNCKYDTFEFVGESQVDDLVYILYNRINKIEIHSVVIGSQLVISDCEIQEFFMHQKSDPTGSLFFDGNIIAGQARIAMSSFEYINIDNNRIKKLKLTGVVNRECEVDINKLQVEEISFFKLINEGRLSLRQVSVEDKGKVFMITSNLGKADFLLCDFENSVLEFENSKLTEIFLAETEFPKKVELNGKKNHRQAQLAFGQISAAFQKQGDTVRALDYQAREIEAHYRQLIWFDKSSFKFSFTKFSLWLNKCSNDFGRSWQRAVLFSILAGLFFFYLVVISSNEYNLGFGFVYDPRVIPSYYRFMNPLRFFELESIFKIGQEKPFLTLNGWSYFFDLLGRVFVAYGFYQTIQAFRKYGRK